MKSRPKQVYLAVPYSHKKDKIKRKRFRIVNEVAATLFKKGLWVFSPISHTHPIKICGEMSGDWNYWAAYDEFNLSHCDYLYVLMLRGWEKSVGVRGEIEYATQNEIPIEYINYNRETKEIDFWIDPYLLTH